MPTIHGQEIKLYVFVLTLITKEATINETSKKKLCFIKNLYGLAEYLIKAATLEAEKTITNPIANKIKLIRSNHLSIFLSKLPLSYYINYSLVKRFCKAFKKPVKPVLC